MITSNCGLNHIKYINAVINIAMIETTTANQKAHLEIMIIPVPVDGFGTVIEQNISIIAHTCIRMMNHFK